MAINFDTLPDDSNSNDLSAFQEGTYLCIIENAEMKKPKPKMIDGRLTQNPDYLNLRYGVYDGSGKRIQGVFDMQFESSAPLLQYKLKQFIKALGIGITGTFELKDLTKLINDKEFKAVLKVEEGQDKPQGGKYPDKVVVDVYDDQIYYPTTTATADVPAPSDKDVPPEPAEENFVPDQNNPEEDVEY